MYKHVLISTDGSALSEMAVRQGVALAKAIDAKVTGITVSSPRSSGCGAAGFGRVPVWGACGRPHAA
jgi:nucleotide-binding universal stress UspA family protein